jgi:hypothetical protein
MDWAERSQEVARLAVEFELVDPQKSGVHAAPLWRAPASCEQRLNPVRAMGL